MREGVGWRRGVDGGLERRMVGSVEGVGMGRV